MKLTLQEIIKSSRVLGLLIGVILLKFLNLFGENLFLALVFHIVLLLLVIEVIRVFYNSHKEKNVDPVNLILNIGLLGLILIILETFSGGVLNEWFTELLRGKIYSGNIRLFIIATFYALIFILFISYFSSVLIYLFFLKQKKNLNIYFYTIWILIFLSAFSRLLGEDELRFLRYTFVTVAGIMIFINSLRISWIVFLPKKQKIIILFLSIALFILFIILLSVFSEEKSDSILIKTLFEFSPFLVGLKTIIFVYCLIYFGNLFFITLFNLPTSEAFERKAQEVSSLQSLSKILTQVFNSNELSESITKMAMDVCQADASWIRIKNKGSQFVNFSINKIPYSDEEIISNFIINGINEGEFSSNGFINLKDYKKKININTKYNIVLYAQMKAQNEVIGYLFTSRTNGLNFDSDDLRVLKTFAEYSAIAFFNNRLYKELIEKEKLEKEFDVARDVQMRIIPQSVPKLENYEIATSFLPAFEVGGDYFDFFEISEDKIGIVIADVSGKGIGAAFYMAEVKGIFESLCKILTDPKEILIQANSILKKSLNKKNFVTAAFCLIDKSNCSISISRAGHCPPILLNDNGFDYIRTSGIGLGLDDTEIFRNSLEQREIKLKKDDILLLITDGISEAKNYNLDDYGYQRLEKVLYENRYKDVNEIALKIIEDITLFSEQGQQYDDITLVIIKCKENRSNINE